MKEFVHLTAIKFVSQNTVYELMNVWSDLKHLRAHEHGECSDPWSEAGSDEEITSTSVNHLGMP